MIKEIAQVEQLHAYTSALKTQKFKPGFDNMDGTSASLRVEINEQYLSQKRMRGQNEAAPCCDVASKHVDQIGKAAKAYPYRSKIGH